jgi:uncharacterized membrane protein
MGTTAIDFFSEQDKEAIKLAIMNAELDTSGEIRVHIESTLTGDVLDRTAFLFSKLGMDKTAQRNGVLIYLALKNRRFAIIGDAGINQVVPADFWNDIKSVMISFFREGNFTDGLIEAITRAGLQLKQHFPYQRGDVNELKDEISFGN